MIFCFGRTMFIMMVGVLGISSFAVGWIYPSNHHHGSSLIKNRSSHPHHYHHRGQHHHYPSLGRSNPIGQNLHQQSMQGSQVCCRCPLWYLTATWTNQNDQEESQTDVTDSFDYNERGSDDVKEEHPSSSSSSTDSETMGSSSSSTEHEIQDLVRCVVCAADGRKADDIIALRVRHITTMTSYLAIMSGNSRPQNQAISAAICNDVLDQFGFKPGGHNGIPEGTPESGWIVLDYGTVMVHIMTPKSRLYYNIERQWRDKGGTYMDISDLLIPNKIAVIDGGNGAIPSNNFVSEEEDPFWS